MERWVPKKGKFVEEKKVDDFILEVIEVCKKHKMSIGHEDPHGSFVVHKFSQKSAEWLMEAEDDR